MITQQHPVNGQTCYIYVAEHPEDLVPFIEWASRNRGAPLAVDTETTGLECYSEEFRLRLCQFGTETEAWVIPCELGPEFQKAARQVLEQHQKITFHNATFDVTVLTRQLGILPAVLWNKLTDTKILAHLLDPRGKNLKLGDVGHGLKALSSKHIDPDAPDTQDGLKEVFKAKTKKWATMMRARAEEEEWDEGRTLELDMELARGAWTWATIPTFHPTYILYAGLDVLFTARLRSVFLPAISAKGLVQLAWDEHQLARICWQIQDHGVRVDYAYAEKLYQELDEEHLKWVDVAASLGLEMVSSTQQVAAALIAEGATLRRLPATKRMLDKDPDALGNWCVDEKALRELAGWNKDWEQVFPEQSKLAGAVMRAKRAAKWREAYVVGSLTRMDSNHRVHPGINSLAARTGRMSISAPPLQQIPTGDYRLRSLFAAEPGHDIVTVDYSAIEMRILAARSGCRRMIDAIRAHQDLHDYTASLIDAPRKVAKTVGFGKVYGGGADTLAGQSGLEVEVVRRAIKEYNSVYPEIMKYSRKLQAVGKRANNTIRTDSGRILICDPDRHYALLNYDIQSTAKDILMYAMIRADKAGMTPYLRLPVHDEMVASVSTDMAEDFAQTLAEIMRVDNYLGVPLDTEYEVSQANWGNKYLKKAA